jgi:exopolysaccharide biosynthesis polyprenyl glycosylphosphotransferase
MLENRQQLQAAVLLVGDMLATALAVIVAYWLRFEIEVVPVTRGDAPLVRYVALIPVVVALWPTVFYFQGLYQRRHARFRFDELVRVMVAVSFATVLLAATLTFYRTPDESPSRMFTYSRLFLVLLAVSDVALVAAFRWGISAGLAHLRRRGGMLCHVLVVGAGQLGREVAGRLAEHVDWGIRVVGFLDDDPGRRGSAFGGTPVVGTTAELEEVVARLAVDEVVLALPLSAHARTAQLIRRAGQLLVEVKVVPDLLQYYVLRAAAEDLDGLPVISLAQVPFDGWSGIVKRTADLIGASLILVLTLPILPLIALRIWLEDRGPVLYFQDRTGLDGRRFRLVKFRTMRVDAEDDGRARWTRANDPRVTGVGDFLRRTHLDELPQLVNVLRGEMSLVGPRPERPEFVARFRDRYPDYMARHRVRCGVTGLAQVEGLKGDTSIRRRVARDLYYIENWSLGLDVRILWRTLRLALRELHR